MSRLSISGGRIVASRTDFNLKDVLKALPNARWNPDLRAWTFPESPTIAEDLARILPGAEKDKGVLVLLEQAKSIKSAQVVKKSSDLDEIPCYKTKPWLHQLRAFHFVKDIPGAMLALDMGTGKSKVVVDLICSLNYKNILILCPLSVIPAWDAQFVRHAGRQCRVLTLDDGYSVANKKRQADNEFKRDWGMPFVIVTNHESAWRGELGKWITSKHWDLVVIDESHRAKSPGSKFSLFLSSLRDKTSRRLMLTGTPMPHSPLDLYGQFRFLDPGVFGTSFQSFKMHYAIMGGFRRAGVPMEVVGYKNQEEFMERFGSIAYHVRSGDVLDLPGFTHVQRFCELDSAERKAYNELKKELITEIDTGVVTAANAMVKLLRLSQCTSGYLKTDDGREVQVGESKQNLLSDILEDLKPNEPLVVFCRFKHDIATIVRILSESGRMCGELSGSRNNLQEWQKGEFDSLVVQIQSGGVGIDLSRAHTCIYYSVTFSLGDFDQSLARLHRPGQEEHVTYVHLLANHTIDAQVYKALEEKREVVTAVLDGIRQ